MHCSITLFCFFFYSDPHVLLWQIFKSIYWNLSVSVLKIYYGNSINVCKSTVHNYLAYKIQAFNQGKLWGKQAWLKIKPEDSVMEHEHKG